MDEKEAFLSQSKEAVVVLLWRLKDLSNMLWALDSVRLLDFVAWILTFWTDTFLSTGMLAADGCWGVKVFSIFGAMVAERTRSAP